MKPKLTKQEIGVLPPTCSNRVYLFWSRTGGETLGVLVKPDNWDVPSALLVKYRVVKIDAPIETWGISETKTNKV